MNEPERQEWDKEDWVAVFVSHVSLRTGAPQLALAHMALDKLYEGELSLFNDPIESAEVFLFNLTLNNNIEGTMKSEVIECIREVWDDIKHKCEFEDCDKEKANIEIQLIRKLINKIKDL